MNEERSQRSIFVGNIPYDADENSIRQLFSEVGHVRSFRLVTDRDTGMPKGFGFLEYGDIQTAQSAVRNLQGREINGRKLRIDLASNTGANPVVNAGGQAQQRYGQGNGPGAVPATARMDTTPARQQVPSAPQPKTVIVKQENTYGEPVVPKDAPEAISKAVASLPPEQMFELMKEMKESIQNNPHEARNILLQNPQLAYALLQAMVVMRIVDPEVAMKMLHRQAPVQPLVSSASSRTQNKQRLDDHVSKMSSRTKPQPMDTSGSTQPDQEKARLIMQVMNLTTEQIAMLPMDQRKSILELRQQLAEQSKK